MISVFILWHFIGTFVILTYYWITVQLLHKYSIRATEGSIKLLKVIKNPVYNHLPVGCRKILMSFNANKTLNPRELVLSGEPIVIVVGAMAHGQVIDYYIWLLLLHQ